MSKHTQRAIKLLKENGYYPGNTERWIPIPSLPGGGKRKDLYGFIDMEGLGNKYYIGLQVCGQAFSEHHKKITEDNELTRLLEKYIRFQSHKFYLIGYRKVKLKRGGKAMRWRPRIREYYIENNKLKWEDKKEIENGD